MKKLLLISLLIPLLLRAQCVTPTPPQTLTLTPLSPYTVRVQTDHVIAPATGYYAVREQDSNGTFIFINSGYPSGGFTDSFDLLPNTTFCYKIRAFTACGQGAQYSSFYTDEVMVTMPDGPVPYQGAPEPPYNLSATASNGQVLLEWICGAMPTVPGQKQVIQIARSTDGGTSWRQANLMPQTHHYTDIYTFVPGQTYWYKVRSFNNFGWATGDSNRCTVTNQTCGTAWSNLASIVIPTP